MLSYARSIGSPLLATGLSMLKISSIIFSIPRGSFSGQRPRIVRELGRTPIARLRFDNFRILNFKTFKISL